MCFQNTVRHSLKVGNGDSIQPWLHFEISYERFHDEPLTPPRPGVQSGHNGNVWLMGTSLWRSHRLAHSSPNFWNMSLAAPVYWVCLTAWPVSMPTMSVSQTLFARTWMGWTCVPATKRGWSLWSRHSGLTRKEFSSQSTCKIWPAHDLSKTSTLSGATRRISLKMRCANSNLFVFCMLSKLGLQRLFKFSYVNEERFIHFGCDITLWRTQREMIWSPKDSAGMTIPPNLQKSHQILLLVAHCPTKLQHAHVPCRQDELSWNERTTGSVSAGETNVHAAVITLQTRAAHLFDDQA